MCVCVGTLWLWLISRLLSYDVIHLLGDAVRNIGLIRHALSCSPSSSNPGSTLSHMNRLIVKNKKKKMMKKRRKKKTKKKKKNYIVMMEDC